MPERGLIAVIDIGKSNTRLLMVETDGGVVWSAAKASVPVARARAGVLGPELDVLGTQDWLLAQFENFADKARIRTILPVAHGAAMVLLDGDGNVLAAPDYEDLFFAQESEDYAALRDPFAKTFSPLLSGGLNLGKQIFLLARDAPEIFARTRMILTYPQYWAFFFSGVAASEVTSLGCHSDLWRPETRDFSALVKRQGWQTLFPLVAQASDVLGRVTPAFSRRSGLSAEVEILCGIHDSNAAYLAHLVTRREENFAVISSGTWCVMFAHGAEISRLREDEDMLANVDALGAVVPTARFMGGREYAAIAGEVPAAASLAGLEAVLRQGAMALPRFAPGGPFAGTGRIINDEKLTSAGRGALATLYCALVADSCLDRLGAGPLVLVDGPLAENPLFVPILQSLRPEGAILAGRRQEAIVPAARFLAGCFAAPAEAAPAVAGPLLTNAAMLQDYKKTWLAACVQNALHGAG